MIFPGENPEDLFFLATKADHGRIARSLETTVMDM